MRYINGEDEHPFDLHENRSCGILELIINNDEVLKNLIKEGEIKFIQNLINPNKEHTGFIYQIISNNFNSIDVDKFDYLKRDIKNLGLNFGFDHIRLLNDAKVINNIICFPKQMYNEVSAIFDTRYRLHKQVYTHKVVISTQYMINDMMMMMEPIIHMYKSVKEIENFHKLSDTYIIETLKFLSSSEERLTGNEKQIVKEVYSKWIDLNNRKLYKFIGSIVSHTERNINIEDILKIDSTIDINKIVLYKSKIGFVSGTKNNPFDDLYFYDNKYPDVCIKITKDISFLISDTYQECIYIFLVKEPENTKLIEKMRKVFDLLNK